MRIIARPAAVAYFGWALAIWIVVVPGWSAPPPAINSADWATYNHSANGWRLNPAEKRLSSQSVSKLVERWRFPAKGSGEKIGAIHATPIVVNGYTYFGTATDGAFYKVGPDGKLCWKFQNSGAIKIDGRPFGVKVAGGVLGTALVTDDSVFFGDTGGYLVALNRRSGKARWIINMRRAPFPGAHSANITAAGPILANGKVIFAGGAFEHPTPLNPLSRCCHGRGFVLAVEPLTGKVLWKYDVGERPVKFDKPIVLGKGAGKRTYYYGPSTSSVWCVPSFDSATNRLFFGTDTHNSPRQPTEDDPRNYTRYSDAVISIDATTGKEIWVRQITKGDVWNYTLPAYDARTGYKDQSIGDTPKIYTIQTDGKATKVVGCGTKNGGFYVLRAEDGSVLRHTPIYTASPVKPVKPDPRTLALPSPIGGLQTGCATDGRSIFTNGVDFNSLALRGGGRTRVPTGGRVVAISGNTAREFWRHERPRVASVGGPAPRPVFKNVGDPVASGLAVANGVVYFTTFVSNRLVAVDASNGRVLREIPLGPVLCGPSVSRGRVFVGTGNVHFSTSPSEGYFPKRRDGTLYCFGLPGRDELDELGAGNEPRDE